MNERKPLLPSLATAFLSALILLAGCAKGSGNTSVQCGSNQEACNGTCVNVQTDNQNCGSCGMTCGTGTTCSNGACVCQQGLVSCGGQCVASNAMHCGNSCTACTGTQVCAGNTCSSSCATGSMKCSDGACSSNNDAAHCGTSCTVCPAGSTCNNGVCGCTGNQMLCGGACTDVTTTAHCGSCTTVCTSGQSCTNGQCVGGGSLGGNTGGGLGGNSGGGLGGNGTAGTTGSTGGMTGGGGSTRPAGCAAGPDTISDFEEGTTGITIPQAGRQGWWYTFSDPNAGQQTPAKNATGPVATAMDSTDPNAGTCGMNKWAMHSTSSGHINYVGFGTSIAQVLPAPPATATTTKTKNPYDTTTAAYDGVVFDIKSGSGTAPNVWFELANSENQPQPDGTIRTADGTAAGAAQSPSSNATDEYNTRGKLLTNVTTTWQTVYVPFGLLAPRYLPAQATTGPCANGAIYCEAPGFNPKSVLGLQFSVYDQFPKAGVTAGTYDLWVDNVAFYKGANGVSTFTASPNTAKPFPQDSAMVGVCPKPAGASGKFLVDMYLRWKARFVVTSGNQSRVVRPENQNDTVSEGIGYGMLIAVYMGDRTLFDGLYAYWVAHPANTGDSNTLMDWCVNGGGGNGSTGTSCNGDGSATDADEDVAWALIQAGKQWGGTYAASALAMVKQIFAKDIDPSGIPRGGNQYTSANPTNPSYFAPAYYRVFAGIDTNPWASVVTASYTALKANAATFGGGLVSAWCSGGCGTLAGNQGSANPADDMKYQYDAHRVPWRFGLDACWNSTSANAADAKAFLLSNTNFFVSKSTNGIGRVFDIYQMGGVVSSNGVPNSMSAVGTAGVGAMANAATSATAKAFLDRAYRFILDASYTSDPASASTGYTYFNATVGLLTAITMSGNFNSF